MKRFYLAVILCCLAFAGNAQTAASYGFTALSDPFVSIAGTGTFLPAMSDDDYTEAGIPIGFTFNYCGVDYTDLSACTNGWVSLTNSPSIAWDNFETAIDGAGWLMPFWDDNDGGVFTIGNAYHEVSGTAPSRVFTFEWNMFGSISGAGDITFQVKLYETTNIIDFHYGPSSLFLTDATIGISNDNISDWQTLSDESSAPTPLLAPLFETFIFAAPADGQVYRWTPSCTLPPITGTLAICTGGMSTLGIDTVGGTWSSGSTSIVTVDGTTGEITGISGGTALISYATSSSCFTTAVVTVTAPAPITGTLSVCAGLTTMLSHTTTGGTWSSSDMLIADVGTTGLVSGYSVGTSVISYTLPDGCVASAVVTVDVSPSGITGPSTLCQGTTGTYASATFGGTWSSSFTTIVSIDLITGNATAVAGGVANISYIMPSGCFRITTVTVNPLPAPITGGSSICIAGTFTLSNTTAGGTWSSSTPGVATIDVSSGLVTGVAAGTTTISYILLSGCYRTTVVTVSSVVTGILGSTTLCKSESTTLSNLTPGGTWSSSDIAVGTIGISTGVLYAVSAGTTTISYVLGSGCFTTVIVTVNPLEPITGTASVCQGNTTTLSNAVAPGTWTSTAPGFFTVNPSTGVVTGVAPGTADLTYLNSFGCTAHMLVTVNPLPSAIAGDMLICVGTTSSLSSAPAGGAWSHTPLGAATVDAVTGIVTGTSVGVTGITYTLPVTGCRATTSVTVDPAPAPITGINVLCPGTTSILSHPVSGGTWASSDVAVATVGASSAIVTGTGLAGGTVTISYTLPSSLCVVTYSMTVSPAPAPITGVLSVCTGNTTTLSTASVGATWGSSNTAVATIGAATGIVSGLTSGTSIITCYGTNGCFRTATVTVNITPSAITGTAVVCVAATTTLSSTPGGGAWSSSSLPTATVTSGGGVVTGINANTATITYTLASGCFTTRVVTVNALPGAITGTASVCVGLTTTLTSSPPGATWSSGSANASVVASTGVVTGNTAGTANISYTLSTGCYRTRTVTVNALPVAIAGPTNVCPGSTISLTDASPGGTWISSTPVVGTINTGSGVLTGLSGGTTTVTYTLGTGCIATTVVTVIAAPIALITPIGDTIMCPGDFVTLTSGAAGGATYTWFNTGTPIAGATSPTYIATTAGSYQVRISIAAGCTTISPPMSVTINPATATITVPGGVTTTCDGTPVTLNGNTGAGLTYQWNLAGVAIPGATASAYNALLAGIYTVKVTNAAGCTAVSAPVTITVNPAPDNLVAISGPLTFCNGSNVVFTAAAGVGYTYQWYNSLGAIAGATSISYSATTAQSYHVMITNTTGCTTTTANIVTNVNPLPNVGITAAGPLVFCSGGNVLLSTTPGYVYQWYRGGIAIAGATTFAFNANVNGGYRVRVTNPITGCTDMTHADTVVHVLTTPVINPLTPTKFCWGGSSLLTTSVSGLGGAVGYQWAFGGVPIPGATGATYNANAGGFYTCTISVPMSCTLVTLVPVEVTQVPLPDPPISFNGTIFKTGNYYITYQWYKNLVAIPGANTFTTPATSDGNYKVAVTDTNGCQSMSSVYVLSGWKGTPPTIVTDVNKAEISIFPNPASMIVHIQSAYEVRAVISAIDGRAVLNVAAAKDIDISKLADGMYMITVFDTDNVMLRTQRLVKRSE